MSKKNESAVKEPETQAPARVRVRVCAPALAGETANILMRGEEFETTQERASALGKLVEPV